MAEAAGRKTNILLAAILITCESCVKNIYIATGCLEGDFRYRSIAVGGLIFNRFTKGRDVSGDKNDYRPRDGYQRGL
jgi:hypothetical protein